MSSLAYRPEIDGLRAVSVTGVVLFHGGLACPGGYVGVDVFFVISGYLITRLILKDLDAGRFSFAEFWERRARRILPASLTMTAAVLVAGYFLLLPFELNRLAKSAAAHLCFASNIQFWRSIGDYFAGAADLYPLLHTWSLAIEEQFYFVLPALLFVLRGRRRSVTAMVLGGLGVASLALSIAGLERYPLATFYLLPARGWELLVGSLTALWAASRRIEFAVAAEAISAAGLLGIVVPIFLYDGQTPFPGAAALPPCLGCAAVIWSNTGRTTLVGRLLSMRPITFVGLVSYSFYLWHWPFFSFYRILYGGYLSTSAAVLLTAASFLVACAAWRWIETPFRTRRFGSTRRTLLAQVVAVSVLLLGVGVWFWRTDGLADRVPRDLLEDTLVVGRSVSTPQTAVEAVLPILGAADAERIDFVLWGDSHAMVLTSAVDQAARRRGLSGRAAVKSGAQPVPGVWRINETIDPLWAEFVANFIAQHRVKNALLAARWRVGIEGYRADGEPETGFLDNADNRFRVPGGKASTVDEAQSLVVAQLDALAKRLQPYGTKLWILRQVPEQPEYRLALRWMRHKLHGTPFPQYTFSAEEHRNRQRRANEALDEVARRNPNVVLLDPAPVLFDDSPNGSQVIRDGRSLYYDDDHVSAYGARWLTERLLAGVFDEMKREREAAVRP